MKKFVFVFSWLVFSQGSIALCPKALAIDPPSDASGSSKCEIFLTRSRELPLYKLVYHLARTRDIHKMVAEVESTYGSADFFVRVPFSKTKIFFLQDPKLVRSVLQAKTSLGFVNRNFDLSHRHLRTINTANITDELWQDLHRELTDIFDNKSIVSLMHEHKGILLERPEYNLNEALEEFFLKVWSEYTFGKIDVAEYQRVRLEWIEVLGKVFHSNRLNRLPVVGNVTSRLQYRRYKSRLDAIDQSISGFLASAIEQKQGAFYDLYERLRPKYGDNEAFLIARDNSLLGVLVYDFIYGVMLDYVAANAKAESPDWRSRLAKSETTAFLYPWRFRVAEEAFDGAEVGDFFVINLVRAKAPFSAGPRICSGVRLFSQIVAEMTKIYSGSGIRFVNPDEDIAYNGSKDIPLMTSKHEVRIGEANGTSPGCPFHRIFKK